jgi:hypothetical protein
MVSHRAIANRLAWAQDRYPLTDADRVLATASFGSTSRRGSCSGLSRPGPPSSFRARASTRTPPHSRAPARRADHGRALRALPAPAAPRRARAAACPTCGGVLRREGMGRDLHDRFFEVLPGRTTGALLWADGRRRSARSSTTALVKSAGTGADRTPDRERRRPRPRRNPPPRPRAESPGDLHRGVALARDIWAARPDGGPVRPDPVGSAAGGRLYRTGDVARRRATARSSFSGARTVRSRSAVIASSRPRSKPRSSASRGRAGRGRRPRRGRRRRLVAYLECPSGPPEESEVPRTPAPQPPRTR